jgi:hypothetical protein
VPLVAAFVLLASATGVASWALTTAKISWSTAPRGEAIPSSPLVRRASGAAAWPDPTFCREAGRASDSTSQPAGHDRSSRGGAFAQAFPDGASASRRSQAERENFAVPDTWSAGAVHCNSSVPPVTFNQSQPQSPSAVRHDGMETIPAVAYSTHPGDPSDLPLPARNEPATWTSPVAKGDNRAPEDRAGMGKARHVLCEFVLRHRRVEDVVRWLGEVADIEVVRNPWQPSRCEGANQGLGPSPAPVPTTGVEGAAADSEGPIKLLVNPVKNSLLTYASPRKLAILAQAVASIDVAN